jgi:hypothetical protein
MFFVGMSFICQSVWTCLSNYLVKVFSFTACNLNPAGLAASYKEELASASGCLKIVSFNHAAVRMQLFRHIFVSVYVFASGPRRCFLYFKKKHTVRLTGAHRFGRTCPELHLELI